jgi:hypothetical protein
LGSGQSKIARLCPSRAVKGAWVVSVILVLDGL